MHVMISVNSVVELSSKLRPGSTSPDRLHEPEDVLPQNTLDLSGRITKKSWSSLPSHERWKDNDVAQLFEKQAAPLLQLSGP